MYLNKLLTISKIELGNPESKLLKFLKAIKWLNEQFLELYQLIYLMHWDQKLTQL